MSRTACTSFKDFFANEDIELKREVQVAVHQDENIANNRLFVWNFEQVDLEEFINCFQVYKESGINMAARQSLNGCLMRKMNAMLREGYNPVECMLYASKVINMKLQNDKELQDILAERIRDIYIKQEEETTAVLKNIIKMWTWVPQVMVVITAVGIIGDNQELLDCVMSNYKDDAYYRVKVFNSLMRNKNSKNLERIVEIIMNLSDSDEDGMLGRIFLKEVNGFGLEGNEIIARYYDNPGMTRTGSRILKKVMLRNNSTTGKEDAELYRRTLAGKSDKDNDAYRDFLADCREKYDNDAFYLTRFSRPEIGDFLKDAIENGNLRDRERNTAIVSLGIIGGKGYSQAIPVLKACEEQGENLYAVTVAQILLENRMYARKLVNIFSQKKDYELSVLYSILRTANVIHYNQSVRLIQSELCKKLREAIETENIEELDALCSNMQIFWDRKMYRFISKDVIVQMEEVLTKYANSQISMPDDIIISMIEIAVHSWTAGVENVMFTLYRNTSNTKIRELSYKKLKERRIEAPK